MNRRAGIELGSTWINRPLSLGEFVDSVSAYLHRLRPLHPLFRRPLYVTGSSSEEFEPLEPNLSNLESFVRRFGWDRKAPPDWFSGRLLDGTLTRDATSQAGFRSTFNSNGLVLQPEAFVLRLRGGARREGISSSALLELPTDFAPEFGHVDLLKQLMQVTVDCWRPERAYVNSVEFYTAQAVDAAYAQTIGWLNYFSDPGVLQDLPDDVAHEPFGPGGVLLTLQRDQPSANDAQAVARAIRIREALLPGGWWDYASRRATHEAGPVAAGQRSGRSTSM